MLEKCLDKAKQFLFVYFEKKGCCENESNDLPRIVICHLLIWLKIFDVVLKTQSIGAKKNFLLKIWGVIFAIL